ncbi:MAG TPA: amino acid adenylation domain-containing protein, partial [Thermoanaerobaculia bacterium]|nr:amino acid adenylation domain-containing protein [Thermoanaerobaculia bacterium]
MTFASALERFYRQAATAGGAAALALPAGVEVSYAELAGAVGDLACRLVEAGIPAGARVAVLAEDRATVVTALLACLDAGCAFVPLDPDLPPPRLRAMLAVVEPACCVLEPVWRRLWAAIGGEVPVLAQAAGSWWPAAAREPVRRPLRQAGPDELCSIYFTSGSTGTPKAIAGRRSGVDHFVDWEIEAFAVGPGTRVSQLTRPAFDAFLRDVLTPLASGGTVTVPGRDDLAGGAALARWLERSAVALVHTVPTLLRQLLAARLQADALPALRHVLLSGERLLRADVESWCGTFGERIRLVNLYGPTETTMTKLFHLVSPLDAARPAIPIGKPMPGAQALIVDPLGRPCRQGSVGEIYLRTPYRSLGYFNRPDLTAAAFVANPLGDDPDDLVYRTGDLGRVLPDGNFDFLGRRDQQVKVRGVRVEIAEIEDRLRRHPGVTDVAVVDREDAGGGLHLHAYVVGDGDLPAAGLRAALARELPEAFLPDAFLRVAALPRTLSGKVDRNALPRPVAAAAGAPPAAPRTPLEELAAGLVAGLLGRDAIGAGESFFDLGGHSLLATQLLARVRATFAVEVPLGAFLAAPTAAGLAAAIAARDAAPLPPPPRRFDRPARPPLSFAQQRLWFLDQLEEGGVAYDVCEAVRLTGRLDLPALGRALTALVARHEALRTSFPAAEGQPYQEVAPPSAFALPLVDLCELPAARREPEAAKLRRQQRHRRFDLRRGPLLVAAVLGLARGGETAHQLLLTAHHIVCDAWSMGIVAGELAALYRDQAGGNPGAMLPELPLQYADYALWQREWLRGEALARDLDYWRGQLGGRLPRLRLAVAGAGERAGGREASRASRRLAAPLVRELRRLARDSGATLFMTLLAGFQLLLSRLSGELEVVVGSPIAGRRFRELEGLIGMFVNTLALRTDLSGGPSFRELLARVRATALAAYAHQDLPFERLVEELQLERDPRRNPIFDVLFNLVNTPRPAAELPGLRLASGEPPPAETKLDLSLTLVEEGEELGLYLLFARRPLAAAYGEALLAQLELLLAQAAAAPERGIDEYSLLAAGIGDRLPDPGAELRRSEPRPVHELFFARAAAQPAAPAVLRGDRAWTYGELAARARELAGRLAGAGIGPGTVVAVSGEQDCGLIVALIAVLAAGGVLLPVAPELPPARRRLMLAAARARLLLWIGSPAPGAAVQDWPEGLAVMRLAADPGAIAGADANADANAGTDADANADADAAEPAAPPPGAPPAAPAAVLPALPREATAYVVFTSGSAGAPRAVIGRHAGLSHFVDWERRRWAIGPRDRVAQVTSLAVDVVLRECFVALAGGAALCLPRAPADRDGPALLAWLERDRVTVLHTVPSLLRAWLAAPPAGVSLASLRLLLLVGEPLDDALVARWRQLYPRSGGLVNLYGSTETNLVKCFYEVPEEVVPGVQPAGLPLPESQLLVLAGGCRQCGVGEPGEVAVRSPFLSGGYLDDPAETARRFVPHPLGGPAGERIYRTGDRGHYLPDGCLAVTGRLDDQVKIRGLRIEPSEVAAVLAAHPAVGDCAVVARAGAAGEPELVAYVAMSGTAPEAPGDTAPEATGWTAPEATGGTTPEVLAQHAARHLPAAAVPGRFVFLAALPRLASGKLDRAALPAAPRGDPPRLATPGGAAPAATPVEELVAAVWSELLGGAEVTREGNFFTLGGHSLLAMRVVSRLETLLGVRVPVRELFEAQSLADFARRVALALAGGAAPARPAPRPGPRAGSAPLSLAQQRLWLTERLHLGTPLFNLPTAVRLSGELDAGAFSRAFDAVVARHEVLRSALAESGGEPVQRPAAFPPVLVRVDLAGLAGPRRDGEVERLARRLARRPFALARGPLLRAALLRLSGGEHVLLLVVHHAVFDAWSRAILVDELAALYEACRRGAASPLPEPPLQYADFARWQRHGLAAQAFAADLDYWRRQLAGPLPRLSLPYSGAPGPVPGLAGRRLRFALPPVLHAGLRRLARERGATLFMVLLAGLQTLLHRYGGGDDVVVGTDVANRTHAGLEGLIGFFANQLVLRTDLSGDPRVGELLARVREVVLGAHAHQELPFDRLVEELNPERGRSLAPLFQVKLGLVNVPEVRLALSGLELAVLEIDNGMVQHELLLFMGETGGGLAGAFHYDAELFAPPAIARLRRHLQALWSEMVERPEARLGELALLSAGERQQLVVEWNEGGEAAGWPG